VSDRAAGYEGGIIQLDNVSLNGTAPDLEDYNDVVVDSNTPAGYLFSGKMSSGQRNLTHVFLGNGLFWTNEKTVEAEETDGNYTFYRPEDGGTKGAGKIIASAITWDGTPPSGTSSLRYCWQRVGNIVFFWMRMKYATPGTTNTNFVAALPSDMPTPYTLADTGSPIAASELITPVFGGLATSPTATYALSKAFLRVNSGATGFEFGVQLNSSSVSAAVGFVSGHYFTA
jgi:hypothetical protein